MIDWSPFLTHIWKIVLIFDPVFISNHLGISLEIFSECLAFFELIQLNKRGIFCVVVELICQRRGWLSFLQWKVNYLNPSYTLWRPKCKKWWPHSLFIHFVPLLCDAKKCCWKMKTWKTGQNLGNKKTFPCGAILITQTILVMEIMKACAPLPIFDRKLRNELKGRVKVSFLISLCFGTFTFGKRYFYSKTSCIVLKFQEHYKWAINKNGGKVFSLVRQQTEKLWINWIIWYNVNRSGNLVH